jgi:hypothetical protein
MDEPFNPDEFLISFPLWLPINPKPGVKAMVLVQGPDGEKAIPLFTDEDLVRRFLQSVPRIGHYALGMVEHPAALVELLEVLESEGFTDVTIDQAGSTAAFFPIAQLRSKLQGPQGGAAPFEGA